MNKTQPLISLIAGFLGAFIFHIFWGNNQELKNNPNIQFTKVPASKLVTTNRIDIVDSKGKVRMQLGLSGNSPGLWIMDEAGVPRGIFGLYEDNTAYLGLQDNKGQMIQLLRAYGPNEAPFHIFKTKGSDQMIIGLNSGAETIPFLMTYKTDGTKEVRFGKYEGP